MSEHGGGHGDSHGGGHESSHSKGGEAGFMGAIFGAINETVDNLLATPMAKLTLEGTTKPTEEIMTGITSGGGKPVKGGGGHGGGGHGGGHH